MKRLLSVLFIVVFLTGCSGAAPAPTSIPARTIAASTATIPVIPTQPAPTTPPVMTPTFLLADNQYAFEQNKRLGRGVNLGDALEAPNEGDWGMTLEEGFFKTIHEGGFNSVRIPIFWSGYITEKAPYTIDPVFLKRVDWAIEQAIKNQLAVVINIHNFTQIMEEPVPNKERFLSIWRQLAEHYKSYPDGLYFELLNEPNGTFANTTWDQYAVEAVQEIRMTNPKRMIIIGPGNWNSVLNIEEMALLPNDRNLIITFHYYLPFHFTHQGAEWVDGSLAWMGTTWMGSEDEKKAVISDFDMAARWAKANQRPIYMGEFGAYSKADSNSRHLWTTFVVRAAEERGFSWSYWEFGAGFGVYDRIKKAWNEPIYSALIPQ